MKYFIFKKYFFSINTFPSAVALIPTHDDFYLVSNNYTICVTILSKAHPEWQLKVPGNEKLGASGRGQ